MANELRPEGQQIEGEAVVRLLFERVYSKGELNVVDELVAPNFVGHCSGASDTYLGPDGVKAHVHQLRTAFYGFAVEIDHLRVVGDAFEAHWTARGTHERPFVGIEPTCDIGRAGEEPHGTQFVTAGVTEGTVTNGTLRESAMVWNVEELRHQLGSPVGGSERDGNDGELLDAGPVPDQLASENVAGYRASGNKIEVTDIALECIEDGQFVEE